MARPMPEYCTCGAQLPPDALFCHKCGKPQGTLVTPELEADTPPAPPAAEPPSSPAPVSFRDPVAVRVAAVTAVLSFPLSLIPMAGMLVWLAAGAMSALFYARRTRHRLDWRNGLRIGWMTGFFSFALVTVLFTVGVAFMAAIGGPSALNDPQFRNLPMYDEQKIEALRKVLSVSGVLQALVGMFVTAMALCGVGGALGSRLGRD